MISSAAQKSFSLDGMEVPLDFPYASVFLQGPPKHSQFDEFSLKHPPLERAKRAKIFAPFDALDGYGDAVRRKDVEYVAREELSDEQSEELSCKLADLQRLTASRRLAKENLVRVTVTNYVPCEDADSFAFGLKGRYETVSGICWKVDLVDRTMVVGDSIIFLDNVKRVVLHKPESVNKVFFNE